MVRRAAIKHTDTSKKCQTAQVVTAGQTLEDVEIFESYGLTSTPPAPPDDGRGAEGVVLELNGHADHPVLICVGDRRYRIKGLASGEVALYDDLGQQVYMSRSGIRVIGVSGKYVSVEAADVRLGSKTETEIEALAKWDAIKGHLTQLKAALEAATAAGGGAKLSFTAPLPDVPSDSVAATSTVRAK